MGKKHFIALGIIVASFALFFYYGFLNFMPDSPFVNLFSFVGLVIGTLAALFVGNSGKI